MKNISVLIPSFNEDANLLKLIPKVNEAILEIEKKEDFEIIIINDGSWDKTEEKVKSLKKNTPNLKLINLKQNMGKAYALDVGIKKSEGKIIASIDADMQYEPKDFLHMIKKINEGYDFVNGRRSIRKDTTVISFFSFLYNFILRKIFRCQIFDFFSGIKVYKKKIYDLINLNSLPRFIIFFSIKYKYKLIEIDINHRNREFGKSKYNLFNRIILCLQDIFVIFICVILGQGRIYVLKQLSFIIFFIISIVALFLSFNFDSLSEQLVINIFIVFLSLFVFFKIIENFFDKKTENLNEDNYIKSIDN